MAKPVSRVLSRLIAAHNRRLQTHSPSNVLPLPPFLCFGGSGSALHIGEVIPKHAAISIGPRHDSTVIPLLEQFRMPFVKAIP